MNDNKQTAGETAKPNGYPKRARLFSPDGHANNDIITMVENIYVERFLRAHARRIGWPCCIRKAEVQPAAMAATAENNWRKPATIVERPRPKLFGAFNLTLTASTMEGGAR